MKAVSPVAVMLFRILSFDLHAARAVLAHSCRCLSAARRTSERRISLAGIGAADDVPIARRLMVCREPEDCFERGMPMKPAIIAEDELVKVRVDMLAAEAMIGAQAPSLHQRENPVNPRQHDMPGHLAQLQCLGR